MDNQAITLDTAAQRPSTTHVARVESLDLLKGLIMVIMALDHTRDYFHYDAFFYDPADPEQSNLVLFFTRWITHFCAPGFSFLAGVSAFLAGRRRSKRDLPAFLLKRGLFLVIVELTVVNFGWYFNIHFHMHSLLVIWALGVSMILLAMIIHLPRAVILGLSLVVIFGHNLLDSVHFEESLFWAIIHDGGFFFFDDRKLLIAYPLVPWFAVMSFGYACGSLYNAGFDPRQRRKIFNIMGIASIALFFALRSTNVYGDPIGWTAFSSLPASLISFFNPLKYPPSLQYLLMTLGGIFIFLGNTEFLRGRFVGVISTFGKVPFFYYILHLYFIHGAAMIYAELAGFGWNSMVLSNWATMTPELQGFGLSLLWVYAIWILIVVLLYPLCKKFCQYKLSNKHLGWLSYL